MCTHIIINSGYLRNKLTRRLEEGETCVNVSEGRILNQDTTQTEARRMETISEGVVGAPSTSPTLREGSRRLDGKDGPGVKGKKRGANREVLTLGGAKRQETNLKRKMKRKVNKLKGKAGFPAQRKKADRTLMERPISVLFVDNTKGGLLAKKFREEEKRLGLMTGYNVRVAETAGMPLSRILPSTNPWGPGDCGRQDCPVCMQGDEKTQNCKQRNILYESC